MLKNNVPQRKQISQKEASKLIRKLNTTNPSPLNGADINHNATTGEYKASNKTFIHTSESL